MKKSQSPSDAQPTDLELMQFFDGELPEPRRTEVSAFVLASAGARAKLDGLSDVGLFLRVSSSDAADPFAGDDLAARVISRAASTDETNPRPTATASPTNDKSPANDKLPANDNGRRIFGLAGMAAVAAAALVYWGRSAPVDGPGPMADATGRDPGALVAPGPSTDVATTAGVSPNETAPAPTLSPTLSPNPAPLDEGGVEIASVDFGRRSGGIFRVPTDARGATTTVLWLSDE